MDAVYSLFAPIQFSTKNMLIVDYFLELPPMPTIEKSERVI